MQIMTLILQNIVVMWNNSVDGVPQHGNVTCSLWQIIMQTKSHMPHQYPEVTSHFVRQRLKLGNWLIVVKASGCKISLAEYCWRIRYLREFPVAFGICRNIRQGWPCIFSTISLRKSIGLYLTLNFFCFIDFILQIVSSSLPGEPEISCISAPCRWICHAWTEQADHFPHAFQ